MKENNCAEILNVEQLFCSKYVVPLYQRNFAWGEEQISRLLNDIGESYKSKEQQYFVGSLVVIKRKTGDYEVIDGQQRLTTLALISYVLQFNFKTEIHYDSRPEVERFLESLALGFPLDGKDSSVSHFVDAKDIISSTIKQMEIESGNDNFRVEFSAYIREHVCLVRDAMPEDTDVASYFEIMNNRGEQLQEHEIVKGYILEKLKDNHALSQTCASIWDACSQMDERIQKSFSRPVRIALFGEDYNSLTLTENNYKDVLAKISVDNIITEGFSLDKILEDDFLYKQSSAYLQDDEDQPERNIEESILDFPNFLMHVLKLYYDKIPAMQNLKSGGIPLNDQYLLKVFETVIDEIDSTEFIYRLLRCRTIFDRYVVKTNYASDDDEEGRDWSLLKPELYRYGNRNQLRFPNTFNQKQDMIVKALSCIQVSQPSKLYKNYLQTLLGWFKDKEDIFMDEDDYLLLLNKYICGVIHREEYSRYFGLFEYTPDFQGTRVSHLLLNYIDYVLWNLKMDASLNIEDGEEWKLIRSIKDFRFQYWNSVEHHYPQNRQQEHGEEDVSVFNLHCLGNVFLVGKSTNSRLSDKNPYDKATLYSDKDNIAPNRQMVYSITKASGWGKKQIENHLKFIETVYNNTNKILIKNE